MNIHSLKRLFTLKAAGIAAASLSAAALAQQYVIPEFILSKEPITAATSLPDSNEAPQPTVKPVPAVIKRDSLFIHAMEGQFLKTDYYDLYAEFCKENEGSCGGQGNATSVILNEHTMNLLSVVNVGVNKSVEYRLGRTAEYDDRKFVMPKSINGNRPQGDCEDYAYLKRDILRQFGVPMETLMMASVYIPETDEAHAVLIVRTTGGDYILDNRHSEVKLARDTEYEFKFVSLQYNDWFRAPVAKTDDLQDENWLKTYSARPVAVSEIIPTIEDIELSLGPEIVVTAKRPEQLASATLNPTLTP